MQRARIHPALYRFDIIEVFRDTELHHTAEETGFLSKWNKYHLMRANENAEDSVMK